MRLGKAATIHQATTAFESCQIVLSNLPADVTEANIIDLTTPFGNATVVLIDMTPTNLLIAHVDYAQCIQASRAVNYLNNMDYRSLKLAARLNIRTVESATGSVLSRKVKIRWNAPSLIAWAHYKTITVAKKQAEVLNGKAFSNGRKITASFLRPRKSQTHSFTVELGLPLGTESADIVAFCTEATGVTLGGPTYDLQSCTENVYNLLQGFGSVDSFDVVPDNNTKVKVLAFARFSSVETAAMAARAHGSNPEFLKGNTLSIEHVHWMKYAIPSLQFKAVKADLDRLRQSHDKEPKLHYHDQDAHGLPIDPVRVHIYAANPKAVARLRMALEIPLKGKLLVSNGKCVWDEYFNTREGAYFIRKLNADSEFLVQCDTRTRTLRLCGPVAYLERAHHMITSQLGDVYTRRHVINLRNGLVRPLITGGLNMLQNGPGSGKLTLDVTAPSLTIRGDSGDYERVRRALAAMDSASPVEKTQNASVPCPVCLCEATDIDAIALSCGHVYCMLCLQCLLRSAAGPDFFLPRCVAESRLDGSEKTTRCNTDISLDVICDVLSPEEEKALLESSFSSHIHRRPEEFQYCPTLNCQAVYRTDDSGTVLRCPSCLTWICPACHVDFHEGLTCTEYQDISREVHRKM